MAESYRYFLNIAGVPLEIHSPIAFPEEEPYLPFLTDESEVRYRIAFRQVEELPPIPETEIFHEANYRVYPYGEGLLRSFTDTQKDDLFYSIGIYDYDNGCAEVRYLPFGVDYVSHLSNCFFHIGLEGLMLRENRLVFHAAFVRTHLGGILFSGPSGIGKSTQAELWCTYRGSKQINGDRPIIGKQDGVWTGWGSPYAGSSRCYVNESCPITAIVMLRQASECSLRRLDPKEAFRCIYSGLTMNSWDPKFVSRACDLVMDLMASVPVLEFACTPNEEAVNFLEEKLRKAASL